MRRFYLAISLALLCIHLHAQWGPYAQWTWMSCNSTSNSTGSYSSSPYKPGTRMGAVSWKDASGNLWLFGGHGYTTSAGSGLLNDLWKYNPYTNVWTLMKGGSSLNQTGVYGVLGTASSSNRPGAREHSTAWVDAAGNFWLFGGEGFARSFGGTGNFLNDLWKYDPSANQWTWVNGDSTINVASDYGSLGVTAASNKPGGRHHSIAWVESSGTVWLFGGHQSSNTTLQRLNDLWKYNPSTNQWTWVNGDNTTDQKGAYGLKGVAAITNKPGAREETAGWVDASGKFWMFGGEGWDEASSSYGYLNDLWVLDPTGNGGAGTWTWMTGDKVRNKFSVYNGTPGVSNATNNPGSRLKSVAWQDPFGNVGIFGGFGFATSGSTGYLNDLWKYNAALNQWALEKGNVSSTNVNGVYGSQGMAAASNKPGGRRFAISWVDASGDFWLFGGDGYDASTATNGRLNDMWKISYLVLPVKYESFTATKVNETVQLKWVTVQELNSDRFEVQHSIDGINYKTIGVVAAAGNSNDKTYYNFTHNTPSQGTNFYRLKQVDIDEKFEYSEVRQVNFDVNSLTLCVTGNPFTSTLSYRIGSPSLEKVTVRLTDLTGKTIWSTYHQLQKGVNAFSLTTNAYPSGVYILSMNAAAGVRQVKVIKQ